jgi:hypothetical protein
MSIMAKEPSAQAATQPTLSGLPGSFQPFNPIVQHAMRVRSDLVLM